MGFLNNPSRNKNYFTHGEHHNQQINRSIYDIFLITRQIPPRNTKHTIIHIFYVQALSYHILILPNQFGPGQSNTSRIILENII